MKKVNVGERIREERNNAGWTQTALAKRADITPSALSQIESGDRFPSTLLLTKVAKALSVSIDYLLGEKGEDAIYTGINNDKLKSLFTGFKQLSAEDKETILKQIEWLKARRK